MVRAEAIAATSTTRRNRDARSLSMFSPKLRALPSGRVWVAMAALRAKDVTRRIETIPQSRKVGKKVKYPVAGQEILLTHCQYQGQCKFPAAASISSARARTRMSSVKLVQRTIIEEST